MRRPLLLPLVPLYGAGLALREWRLERGWEKVRILWYPVVSVGNLSTGGSGKTPLVIALARLLCDEGFRVDALSRGYGRRSTVPLRVDPGGSADKFGDEPLLIAQRASVPVWVAADRYEAGTAADHDFIQAGGDMSGDPVPLVHLLDDGFQHRQLFRDIDVLMVNREDWNDHLLPAGNLRESVEAAERASVLVIPAEDLEFEQELRDWGWSGPVWRVRRRMQVPVFDGPVGAFCGIARPEQFFAGLEARGLKLVFKRAFKDHHRYTEADVKGLIESSGKADARCLVTTEKDCVRLGDLMSAFTNPLPLQTVGLTIEFDDGKSVAAWLRKRLAETHMAEAHRKAVKGHQPS
jgi:tetraacyldisaccharide 4'-kinase